jgi:hypothetical protein
VKSDRKPPYPQRIKNLKEGWKIHRKIVLVLPSIGNFGKRVQFRY